MLSAEQQAEAEKRLKLFNEEEQFQKGLKTKIRNISKTLSDKLAALAEAEGQKAAQVLGKVNQQQLSKFYLGLEAKAALLVEAEQKLKNEKETMNREILNSIDDKEKYNRSINQIKETMVKIQKAIDDSIKEEEAKRKSIEQDIDKSIIDINDKIQTFKKESIELEEENAKMREKKQQLLKKMSGLEDEFKSKAAEKDEAVKKDKEGLLQNLGKVESQVTEATELNKQFSSLEKKNFDNKLSIYLRTKNFGEICTSMENSANTINKCKQQLTKGVQRLLKAIEITRKCEADAKQLNQKCIDKIKKQNEINTKLAEAKLEKEAIKQRILQLQADKKKKLEAAATQ